MNIIVIAIANAIIWSGVIIFLLLRMLRQQSEIDSQIDRLEEQIAEGKKEGSE